MKTELIIGAFIIGLLFCSTYKHNDVVETFESNSECANLLVQKGSKLMLLNTDKVRIPGVNPIYFNNLEDYTEFVRWQQAMGIKCPILYFQQTYTAQGDKGYRLLPDPVEKKAGLPSHYEAPKRPLYDASHDDPPYNQNSYAGFDQQNQNIGVYTPLDKMYHSPNQTSDNPMDINWHGAKKTRQNVQDGLYDDDYRPRAAVRKKHSENKIYGPDKGRAPQVVDGHKIYGTKTQIGHHKVKQQDAEAEAERLKVRRGLDSVIQHRAGGKLASMR